MPYGNYTMVSSNNQNTSHCIYNPHDNKQHKVLLTKNLQPGHYCNITLLLVHSMSDTVNTTSWSHLSVISNMQALGICGAQ